MPTNSIPVGVPTTLVMNTIYALPVMSVEVAANATGAVLQTSLEATTNFSNISSNILTGAFVRCVTASPTITLRKNGVG